MPLNKKNYFQKILCFVPYSSLGKGFLTGAMTKDTKLGEGGFRNILPRFRPEALEKNQALVDLLKVPVLLPD